MCADVITEELENRLWNMGILGETTAQALLDTRFYYLGLYFALQGGEHRRLRHSPAQIKLSEPADGPSYLIYTKDVSKTKQGGLAHRNREPKVVKHYQNTDCPKRCLVRIFKLYNQKCPLDRPSQALYLKPLSRPKGEIWYQNSPIGHNILRQMVSCMMKSAKITGYFTNHSR